MVNFVQFTTTVQEEIVFKRFEDKDYQRVSRWLIQHGYKGKRVPNNIIAEVFSKAGSPDLYLYRPYLGSKGRNKPITVEYVEVPEPADLDKGIIYLPEYFKIAVDKHESYLWAPRAVSSKPIMFNFSVAAEHLGVSESLIRLAHYSLTWGQFEKLSHDLLRPNFFGYPPRMNFNRQHTGFDRRVGFGDGFGFVGSFGSDDENAAQVSGAFKRPGSGKAFVVQPAPDVPHVFKLKFLFVSRRSV
jgi:hypothetical protein